MPEREKLEQAIAHLETQRAVLGDAVVDASIAAIRQQLATLEPELAGQQRKQVAVLFADVSGFTAMSETMDAEEVSDTMNLLWQRMDAAIIEHGGIIDKHIGDAVMALWGVEKASEDDSERAIRTALAMQVELAVFRETHDVQLAMRIGINTGPVLLGSVGTTGEVSAIGDAVNLASRLEHAAPIGGVLISHDTYRHVRGVFDVLPQEPIQVRGKAEPVRTYIVQQAKPRAFRMATRGVEGIETRMVGRDAELLTLQNAFHDTMEDAETRVVTVVGEAGVGKSRLLYEFENWIELLPEQIRYFKGRATPEIQAVPYGIIHRMFAFRFEILESDSAATVLKKFRAEMAGILGPDQADLVGHLIGFDFSASPAVRNLLGGESFAESATANLTSYVQAMAGRPTVMFLEDVHWADDSSLDLIDHLVTAVPDARLLVVCLARPLLFERRPSWGEGREAYTRIDLKPLSRRASRALVAEILQKVEDIPDDLRDLVVDGAEGNPFYVEELIKMLSEDGVIQRGEERWHVELDRLAGVRVPPTLTGVLQARLDSLSREERTLLQRASVVGRLFWDAAVAELEAGDADRFDLDRDDIAPLLDAVRGRELVFRRERSAFEATEEYIFKHALLRDVTYETVLLKLRRVYHAQVAAWLETAAGERLGEYLGLIAAHYELAGEETKAVEYLSRAGDQARLAYAHEEAIDYYQRALALLQEQEEYGQAARTLMRLGLTYHNAFYFQEARQAYEEGFALWRRAGEIQQGVPPPAPHALRILSLNPTTLDPTMAYDTVAISVIDHLFSGLVEASTELDVVPDVARTWEVLEGGREYVFHLRDDVYWSDGVPVTAGDFEYAWRRVLDPAVGSPAASLLYDLKGARAFHQGEVSDPDSVGVRALDDATLAVELEGPTGYFLHLLAHCTCYPVPRHAVEAHGEAWTEVGSFVTNGPFRLEAWERGELMVLARNPNYHGPFSGNLQRVELYFRFFDLPAALAMYEADDLDVLRLEAEIERARQRYAGEYVSLPELATRYIAFDTSRPPFDDARVRRAFVLAIDRESLAHVVLQGYTSPATGGFVPPGMPAHSPGIGLPHDPERARQLLAEAGYPGGRGFPAVNALAPGIMLTHECLQIQWREDLGVEVTWEQGGGGMYLRLDEEPAHLLYYGWEADYPDPDNFLRVCPARHWVRWRSEAYEKLVEEARRVTDQGERMQLYRQADRILVNELAVVPIIYGRRHRLVKPWVSKYPMSSGREWFLRDIVIEPH